MGLDKRHESGILWVRLNQNKGVDKTMISEEEVDKNYWPNIELGARFISVFLAAYVLVKIFF